MKKSDLLKLIMNLQDRVAELEKTNTNQQLPWTTPGQVLQPYIQTIHDPCTDLGYHEYPFPWNAVTPPPCKKCGKQGQSLTITSGTVTINNQFCNLCHNIPCSCVTASNS